MPSGVLYGIYALTQYINIISIDQELICSIQFQYFLMTYSKAKLKSNGNKVSPLSDHSEKEMYQTEFYL